MTTNTKLELPLLPRPRVVVIDGVPILTSRPGRNGVSFGNQRP